MPSARIGANELFLADAKRALTPPARAPRATLMCASLTTYSGFAARRSSTRRTRNENYHFVERSYGTLLRSLRLPYSIDTDKIRADFASGVLTVTPPQYKGKENTVG